MSVYLNDTDWIIDALHGQATALQTLIDLAPKGRAISHLTYGELYEGAQYSRTSAHAPLHGRNLKHQARRRLAPEYGKAAGRPSSRCYDSFTGS